ncbi:MAG: DNA-3-methyladenine glycosylase 2 family protein [Candidatus Pacebacteria bacterium]|nr:DNA-3-methyladenine glycosylase 2 family protein [Candidatus Paceibacterota bacterium]
MNGKIIQHFKRRDPILFNYFKQVGSIAELKSDFPKNYFFRICKEIVYQQLSNKAGHAIFARFEKVFPNGKVCPKAVLAASHETLRSSGISHAKARYIRNLAESVVSDDLNFNNFKKLNNEQVIEKLTKVKGIGRWTAEMFLMFTMAREDVFSHGDLGLRKAVIKVYKLKKEPNKEQIEKIVQKWSPYKTYGCLMLWACLK